MTSVPIIHTARLQLRLARRRSTRFRRDECRSSGDGVLSVGARPRRERYCGSAGPCEFAGRGFGRWAIEVPGIAGFIGFVGLSVPNFQAAFTPCVEIGWRLAYDHWGHGYATEAARAALDFGFGELALHEIVSFTVPANLRSRGVMERIGMTRSPADDFDHPSLPVGHPLSRHVLYRARRLIGSSSAGSGPG